MKKLQLKIAKWLLKRLDYKFVAIKQTPVSNTATYVYGGIPTLWIEGDKELLTYVDTVGYLTKKEPLRRTYAVSRETGAVKKLPVEVVAEIALNTVPFPEELKNQNETIN
tara:strand:+ start:2380 stop:2709 length:330 start_codon:yes stop_codon:yes gene_type:complete